MKKIQKFTCVFLVLSLCFCITALAASRPITTMGTIEMTGNETQGYNLKASHVGDVTVTCFMDGFDITKKQISFKLEPMEDTWAWMSFSLYAFDSEILTGKEYAAEHNIIELILWKRADGSFIMSVWAQGDNTEPGREVHLTTKPNFDFDAAHTLHFIENRGYYYLALDGEAMGGFNFTEIIKKYENKEAFMKLGGQSVYSYREVKFLDVPEQEKEESSAPAPVSKGPVSKLGDIEEETESEVSSTSGAPAGRAGYVLYVLMGAGILILGAGAAVTAILVIKKKKKGGQNE